MAIVNFKDRFTSGFDEDALTTNTSGETIQNPGVLTMMTHLAVILAAIIILSPSIAQSQPQQNNPRDTRYDQSGQYLMPFQRAKIPRRCFALARERGSTRKGSYLPTAHYLYRTGQC